MKVQEYRQNLPEQLKPRTLCFLVRDNRVLLGYKKRGFGQGNWTGIGGKVEEGEGIEEATIREMQEEIGITPSDLKKVAVLEFLFPYVDEPHKWNQQVHTFMTDTWEGNPVESEEMKPQWFDADKIPLKSMWSDSGYWLPRLLQGEKLEAHILFNKDLGVEDHYVAEREY